METVLYAFQMSPGNDELLHFAHTQEECQRTALELRAELAASEDDDELGAVAIYRYVLRQLTPAEMILVLNEETTFLKAAAIDRRLVALVAD